MRRSGSEGEPSRNIKRRERRPNVSSDLASANEGRDTAKARNPSTLPANVKFGMRSQAGYDQHEGDHVADDHENKPVQGSMAMARDLVRVTTLQLGGGEPMLTEFIVAESDKKRPGGRWSRQTLDGG